MSFKDDKYPCKLHKEEINEREQIMDEDYLYEVEHNK